MKKPIPEDMLISASWTNNASLLLGIEKCKIVYCACNCDKPKRYPSTAVPPWEIGHRASKMVDNLDLQVSIESLRRLPLLHMQTIVQVLSSKLLGTCSSNSKSYYI